MHGIRARSAVVAVLFALCVVVAMPQTALAAPPYITYLASPTHPEAAWISNGSPTFEWGVDADYSPPIIGSLPTLNGADHVAVSGSHAYVSYTYLAGGQAPSGMQIVDVTTPTAPAALGSEDATFPVGGIDVSGTEAYLGGGRNLYVMDVSDPSAPATIAIMPTVSRVSDVDVSGTFAYVIVGSRLQVVDVSVPSSPTPLGFVGMPTTGAAVTVSGTIAYVADQGDGLLVIDVSNPNAPGIIGSANTPGLAVGVFVNGTTAYVSDYTEGLQVIDVSNPSAPVILGSVDTPGHAYDVAVRGSIAYVTDYSNGVYAVDVSEPATPRIVGYTAIPGNAYKIAISGTTAYVTANAGGLRILDVSGPVAGYSYTINPIPGDIPNTSVDTVDTSVSYSGLSDGTWYFHVRLLDSTGVWRNTRHYEIRIDEHRPWTSAFAAPAPQWSDDVTVTIVAGWEPSDIDVYYRINGGVPQLYTLPFAINVEGEHEVTYWAVDEAGNTAVPKTLDVLIDRTPPTTTDDADPAWQQGPATTTLSATDALSDVAQTVYSVDGGPPVAYAGPFAISAEGTHTIGYRSTDTLGNVESTQTAMVRIDDTAPVTTDDAPLTGWQSTDVTITLSATDALSGVAAIYYDRTGYGTQLYTGPFVVSDEGETDITYWSVDAAGNVEQPKHTETVRIDKSDPVLAAYSVPVTGWASGTALGGADAYDVYSYVHSIWYSIDGGPFVPNLGDIFMWTTAAEGTTRIDMYALDAAGNTSTTETVTLLVDSTPPVTTDDAPAGWVSDDTTVTLSATDPLPGDGTSSGVATTYYRIDGSATMTYTVPIVVTTEGTTNITYWSVDTAGNTEDAHTATVRIDRTGPVVTDDSTPDWQQGPVTVTFTEADAGADASVFHYTLDGSAEMTTAASMEVTGTGVHELAYYGVDSLGNAGPLGHATVRIDDDDPVSASDIDPAWQQGPVDVTITATDAHSGVASIEATITDPPPSGTTTRSVASETMTFTLSAEGTTTVEYHAIDIVGNIETPTVQIVRVDNTAPSVSISPTSTQVIDAMTFTVTATDPLSGVDTVFCSVDGAAAEATDTVRLDTIGDHTIEYWAIDAAGNESAHSTHDVRVSPSATTYVEVAGADRYLTSVQASKRAFPAGADAIIVATGRNWPDALGGAALAGVYDAPVLLTRPDSLPDAVADEIVRLDPGHVFVLGGTGVVSEAVEAHIRSLVVPTANLERFWGADRYITTEIIARRVIRDTAAFDGTAFLATGLTFPDALGAAPLATALERPLYLSGASGISPSALAAMGEAGVTHVVILGGEGAVPAAVETQLDGASITHERLEGTDRYATAIEVAKHGVNAGLSWDKVGLASGTSFADALTGGVMQGHDLSVMVLINGETLDWRVRDTLEAQRDIIGEVRFIGGTGALSQGVRDSLKQVLR